MTDISHGKYIGKRIGEPPTNEAEDFYKCKVCGAWVDYRDLAQVMEHEGPLPHAVEDGAP